MFELVYQITSIGSNICVISISLWLLMKYLNVKNMLTKIYRTMNDDIDKIINDVSNLGHNEVGVDQPSTLTGYNGGAIEKERLIGVVAGGNSKEYLGKNLSSSEVENLDDKEIVKLYARYEAYLGGLITRTLKKHMICAYTKVVQLACPSVNLKVNDVDKLNESLNEGPFVGLALTSLTCKMYHQYGYLLAPIEAALITSNHLMSEVPPTHNAETC
jgi:hypothetical protein